MNKYHLFQVKEGKVNQWKEWCSLLMSTYRADAEDTLRSEHISREYCVIFEAGDTTYVVGAAQFFDNPLPADMNVEINRTHRKMKEECLVKVAAGNELYDISV